MGRKLKYGEKARVLSINVPKSKYVKIRNKLNTILNDKDNLNLFLTIDIIELMKLYKKISGLFVDDNIMADSQILKKIINRIENLADVLEEHFLTEQELQRFQELLEEE